MVNIINISLDENNHFILETYESSNHQIKQDINYIFLSALLERIKKCKDNKFEFIIDDKWCVLELKELKYINLEEIEEDEIKDATLDGTD